jgi:hypothetical protein
MRQPEWRAEKIFLKNSNNLFIYCFKKLYTTDDISLDYFSKYICYKQNFPFPQKDKIFFYIWDSEKVFKFFFKLFQIFRKKLIWTKA